MIFRVSLFVKRICEFCKSFIMFKHVKVGKHIEYMCQKLKPDSHLPEKKLFDLLHRKLFKNDIKRFYFILKALFVLKIFNPFMAEADII